MRIPMALVSVAALLAGCSNSESAKTAETNDAPATAAATSLPTPQAGLWEQTVSGGMMPAPMTVKICVGETAPDTNPFAAPQAGITCSQNSVRAAPGGAEIHSVCESQGMTVTSDGKVSGDMRTAYKVEMTTNTTGPNVPPQMAQMTTTIDAKRLGDCPAGVAPNTTVP